MKRSRQFIIIILAVIMFLGPDFGLWFIPTASAQPVNPPRTSPNLKAIVEDLLSVTTDTTDSDNDGLPDSVEAVIGTDPNNTDSDFDRLDDSWEVDNNLDPLEPDSNFDGMADYHEVSGSSSLDFDGDGIDNAWDFDNDGDGINDNVDYSPFSKSGIQESFHFDITSNGNTLYMSFQLRPQNPDHLKLFGQSWDWPDFDTEGAMQDRDGSKEDVVILPKLDLTVSTPPERSQAALYGIDVNENNISIPLLPVYEHGTIVGFTGRMVYPESSPSDLTMDARLNWYVIGFNDPNESLIGQSTLLATYNEQFALTGVSIEENYASQAAMFYANDANQVVASNLLLAYEFLRNDENHVSDMPNILDSNDINVQYQLDSFSHRDKALEAIMTNMTPQALDALAKGRKLPLVSILEDQSASMDMSEFQLSPDNSYLVDLTSVPVTSCKSLKTTWYDTTSRESLMSKDVMAHISTMGLGEEASYTLMTLMLYWETGEQTLPNGKAQDFSLIPPVIKDIVGSGLSSLETLYHGTLGLKGLDSYKSVRLLQTKGWHLSVGGQSVGDLSKLGNFDKFKKVVKFSDRIEETIGTWKRMSKALKGLEIVTAVGDVAFSIYTMVAICESDAGGFVKAGALLKAGMQMNYAIILLAISFIPYVGWIIALGIEMSNIFGGWVDDVFDWLVGQMVKVTYTADPEINILEGPIIDIDDKDDNGLDVGDRITYSSRLQGKIQGDAAHWDPYVRYGGIYPYHLIYAPAGSPTGSLYTTVINRYCYPETELPIGSRSLRLDENGSCRTEEYNAGGWVEPGTAMVNFPVTIKTEAIYQLPYQYKVFYFYVVYWEWEYYWDYDCGTTPAEHTTLYFDVLPNSISDFTAWRGITPLDHDGDGILDVNEVQSDPWIYDTDGDGICDKYEIDNGTDPRKYDTDRDGLIDWFEIQIGTDPQNPDTDGDGLQDYLEVSGWLIQFEYAGQNFTMRVYSDPAIPDTDGDGVGDHMEYKSGLNPRSADTNGDGINDVANPKDETTVLELETYAEIDNDVLDLAVDKNGDLYVLSGHPSELLQKYDSDMNFITEWDLGGTNAQSMAIDNENEIIYFACCDNNAGSGGLLRYDFNGTPLDQEVWGVEQLGWSYFMELDVDSDGNIYVLKRENKTQWFENPIFPQYSDMGKNEWSDIACVNIYDPNKTLINTWGQSGTLLNESYYEDFDDTDYQDLVWRFYYPAEPNKLHHVTDLALDEQGTVYVSEYAFGDRYYRWYDVPGWWPYQWTGCWECSREQISMMDRISKYNTSGGWLTDLTEFTDPNSGQTIGFAPASIGVDSNGYLYMVNSDNYSIHKFDRNFIPMASWKIASWADDYDGWSARWGDFAVDPDGNIFTYYYIEYEIETLGVIEKYLQKLETGSGVNDPNPDSDSDGLPNKFETDGWDITYTEPNGTFTMHVTSDPLLVDTDFDGLPDPNEYQMGSNPNDSDTDHDGLSDYEEWRGFSPKTNWKHFDTDLDGLSDGAEIAFGSDPTVVDTDQDGLTDLEEFNLRTNPRNADTDGDGISDYEEHINKSNPTSPDTDGDLMFDGAEKEAGTDPNNSDTDKDGLKDGIETIYNTAPLNPDSDNDGLEDGFEVNEGLNPISDDTDNDGVPDGVEIEQGTDPWTGDSDHDGVPDSLDDPNNLAPDISQAHPSLNVLWPPNNKYVEITIEGVTDPEGDPFGIVITGVTSDEPTTTNSGIKSPDAVIDEAGKLYLRAERSGSGNGRVYEISFVAGDSKGETAQGKVQVKVPHSMGKSDYICVDDGQIYDVTVTTAED